MTIIMYPVSFGWIVLGIELATVAITGVVTWWTTEILQWKKNG
jgi:hypothetical protein